MKLFEELRNEMSLLVYLEREFGTMYYDPNLPREEKIIVRHLDGKFTIELLPIYVDLYNAIHKWIDDYTKVQEYVFMPPLLEVGEDYYIRRFYIYYVGIRDYLLNKEDEDYIEPPELFEEMRHVVSQELGNSLNKDVIHKVLRKSLLEPTSKTIYDYRMNKFIIVEPKISVTDLYEWKQKS